VATDITIAREIADQIGTAAFRMMGAKDLVADDKSLLFAIKGCRKYNKIRVTLQGNDLYLVEFIKIGRKPLYTVSVETRLDVYAEDLKPLIERETGLALIIPRVRGINC
jgi:hypothetical protein